MDVRPPRHLPCRFSGEQLHPRARGQAEGSVVHAGNADAKYAMAILEVPDVEDVHLSPHCVCCFMQRLLCFIG